MDYTLENIQRLDKGINKTFNTAMDDGANKEYLELATEIPSKNRTEVFEWLGDFPGMKEWIDARQKSALTDYEYEIAKKDWETSFYVTRDDVIFESLGLVKTKVETMLHALDDHYIEIISELITANGNCYDGAPFFGDHIVNVDGVDTTFTNDSTYTFTKDNVFAVIAAMKAIKKPNGRSMRIKPSMVYIAPDLEQEAAIIFDSAVSNGDTNEAQNKLKYKVIDDMAPGTWCVVDNTRPVKPFLLLVVKKPTQVDRLTQNPLEGKKIFYGIDSMDNAGYSYWQLAHFCDGTGL